MDTARYTASVTESLHHAIYDNQAACPEMPFLIVPMCSQEESTAAQFLDALNDFGDAPECAGPYAYKVDGRHVYVLAPSPYSSAPGDGYILASVRGGSIEARERNARRVANALNAARQPVGLAA
jgi:hypothetical protein